MPKLCGSVFGEHDSSCDFREKERAREMFALMTAVPWLKLNLFVCFLVCVCVIFSAVDLINFFVFDIALPQANRSQNYPLIQTSLHHQWWWRVQDLYALRQTGWLTC